MWFVLWMAVAWPAAEMPYDGVDQDGDGVDLIDVDGDGFASTLAGGADCNDRNPAVRPNAVDYLKDGVDLDCDGADGEDPRPSTVLDRALRAARAALRLARLASGRAGAACPLRGC